MGEVSEPAFRPKDVTPFQTFMKLNPSVEFVRFHFQDYSGVLRARIATKSYALSLAEENNFISLPSPVLTACTVDGNILLEDIEVGEDQLWPDWSSLRVCHHLPGQAFVMCYLKECGIVDGKGFRRCPRTRLQEIMESSKEKHDLDFLVGFEVEFMIFKPDEKEFSLPPKRFLADAGPYSTASLRTPYIPIVEEIVISLVKSGIQVRQYHSEGEHALFEITGEPLPPLHAVDATIFTHETIKTICTKHGLHATMHPKPFEKLSIIGSHMHLSISRVEKEDSFLAGVLEHWAALAAFYAPNFDSYARVKPDTWVCWGLLNKTAPIKKVTNGRWEFRSVDATSNLYLVLIAVLTAGLLGFGADKELTIKDPKRIMLKPLEGDVAKEHGIKDKMPTTLKTAISNLKEDKALVDALGPELADKYLHVKTKEEETFSNLIGSERREISMRQF